MDRGELTGKLNITIFFNLHNANAHSRKLRASNYYLKFKIKKKKKIK
jgi:hypothetical protein